MKAKMNADEVSIRKRIIMAAVECIEKHGFHALTVRRIAKEAHVNIAAINYYFGSKEKLVEEVFRQTLYIGFDENIDDFLRDCKVAPKKAIELFLNHFITGGLQYPNLVKSHFYESFVNNNYRTESVKRIGVFMTEFEKIVCLNIVKKKGKACKIDMVQFWSAVFFPIVFPDMFRDYTGIDFKEPAWRKEYAARLIEQYLSG